MHRPPFAFARAQAAVAAVPGHTVGSTCSVATRNSRTFALDYRSDRAARYLPDAK